MRMAKPGGESGFPNKTRQGLLRGVWVMREKFDRNLPLAPFIPSFKNRSHTALRDPANKLKAPAPGHGDYPRFPLAHRHLPRGNKTGLPNQTGQFPTWSRRNQPYRPRWARGFSGVNLIFFSFQSRIPSQATSMGAGPNRSSDNADTATRRITLFIGAYPDSPAGPTRAAISPPPASLPPQAARNTGSGAPGRPASRTAPRYGR